MREIVRSPTVSVRASDRRIMSSPHPVFWPQLSDAADIPFRRSTRLFSPRKPDDGISWKPRFVGVCVGKVWAGVRADVDNARYTDQQSDQVPSVRGHLVALSCPGGGTRLYLLYVDESGRPKGTSTTHLVVAGLALHEEDCYPFTQSLVAVQRKWAGAANAALELHATDIWSARKDWASVSQQARHRLVRAVFRHLGKWTSPAGREPKFFGVIVHKPSFPTKAMERAHEELFARFDEFITRLHQRGDSHRSLVVADDSSYEGLLQVLSSQWKKGVRLGPLHGLIEVPLYVDSKMSRLVQAADFVAWGIWQYYENGHAEHLQKIHPRFDADGGVQHGLAHLRRYYKWCPCAPCHSRRNHVIPIKLPKLP